MRQIFKGPFLALALAIGSAGAITATMTVAMTPYAQAFGLGDITGAVKKVGGAIKDGAKKVGKGIKERAAPMAKL